MNLWKRHSNITSAAASQKRLAQGLINFAFRIPRFTDIRTLSAGHFLCRSPVGILLRQSTCAVSQKRLHWSKKQSKKKQSKMTKTQTKSNNNIQHSAEQKDAAYYLSLPYRLEVSPIPAAEGAGYTACIPLLGRWSAVGDGETAAEAVADLQAHLPSLVEGWLQSGAAIPEPLAAPEALSGTLSLRLPKTLHAEIAQVAAEEGVSINQFLLAAAARAVGHRQAG